MFKTQCRVKEYNAGAMIYVWRDIRPSNGPAYTYATRNEAWLACKRANDGRRTRDDFRVIDIANNREV
jgi:hypothetical protein